jgi:hypothetical protein
MEDFFFIKRISLGIHFKFAESVTIYSPFCVPAKVTKLIGLKRQPFLSQTNLIIFVCTQNGEFPTFILISDLCCLVKIKKN